MNLTPERIRRFLAGELTWAQLEGMTAEQAYAIASLGYDLYEQGHYCQARTICEGLVAGNPLDAQLHTLLGAVYAAQGEGPAAMEQYRAALSLDPENQDARRNLAELLGTADPG